MERTNAIPILAAFVWISAVHALLGRSTHPLHIVHVVFGAFYLLPIVGAGVWLGPRWSGGLALASALAYAIHARQGWAGEVVENANQLAMAGVFLFVGAATAFLVQAADRERAARRDVERRAQREALVQALATLSAALRQRDDETGAHCERVAHVAVRIGAALGLPATSLELIRLAALAHDLGKIGVPDDVLLKDDALTPEERARIERHPAIAAEILRRIRGAEEIADIVLCHHECPDGSGYPRHLLANGIPDEANVLRVADVFAAFVEARSYKRAMTPGDAVDRMRQLGGKIDPRALVALERLVAEAEYPWGDAVLA